MSAIGHDRLPDLAAMPAEATADQEEA